MEILTLLKWLEELHPNRTSIVPLSEWEQGIEAGYRLLIEQIRIKLKIEGVQEEHVN